MNLLFNEIYVNLSLSSARLGNIYDQRGRPCDVLNQFQLGLTDPKAGQRRIIKMMMRTSSGGEVPMSCFLPRHGRPCYLPLLSSPSQTTSISPHQADILARLNYPALVVGKNRYLSSPTDFIFYSVAWVGVGRVDYNPAVSGLSVS